MSSSFYEMMCLIFEAQKTHLLLALKYLFHMVDLHWYCNYQAIITKIKSRKLIPCLQMNKWKYHPSNQSSSYRYRRIARIPSIVGIIWLWWFCSGNRGGGNSRCRSRSICYDWRCNRRTTISI